MFEWVIRKHIGGRKHQQDNGCVVGKDNILIATVADGLGGHYGGDLASKLVSEKVKLVIEKEKFPLKKPAIWLKQFCLEINQTIILKMQRGIYRPMTTIVLLLIQEQIAYWAYAGDSRLYCISQNDEIFRTRDHSEVQKLLDEGLISEAEMSHHPKQNLLLSCLGAVDEPQIDFGTRRISGVTAFLLCTDGFWEYFSKMELLKLIKSYDIRETATKSMNLVLSRGGVRGDNLTFIVVRKCLNE